MIKGIGRPKLNIPFKKVYEALQNNSSVEAAAKKLDCSIAYLYQECRKRNRMPKKLLKG